MTRAKWTASTLILPILCVAALALAAEPFREEFDQTYNITADGRISLENVNGGVVINVWDRERRARPGDQGSRHAGRPREAPHRGHQHPVRRADRHPHARARRVLWQRHHDHLSVEYTLTVPRGASLDKIDLVNGSLTVSGLTGLVRAELVNGDVKATALTGSVDLDTVNGTVELELDKVGQRPATGA